MYGTWKRGRHGVRAILDPLTNNMYDAFFTNRFSALEEKCGFLPVTARKVVAIFS